MYLCKACEVEKPLTEFHRSKSNQTGHSFRCKPCECARQQARRERRGEVHKRYMRNNLLTNKYGITLAEYEAMVQRQEGLCAICRQPQRGGNDRTRELVVDHDHLTGEVRGLLCTLCNGGLGFFGDSLSHLRSAIAYLEGGQ